MFSFGQDDLTIGCRDKIVTLPTGGLWELPRRKAPRSSISHEQDTTVHEFDPDETIPYQEDFSKTSNWAPSYSQLEIRSLQLEDQQSLVLTRKKLS
jgi:hypothetical protein